MKLTNASATAAVQLHDELRGSEEQYQAGVKNILIPAGTSSTVTIDNTNAAESRAIQAALAAGTVTATQAELAEQPNTGTGVDNYPLTPGCVLGNGVITWLGWTPALAPAADYVVAFEPGVAGADKVVRGFAFGATTEYGAVALALKGTLTTMVLTDVGFTLATDSCTIANNHGADTAAVLVLIA